MSVFFKYIYVYPLLCNLLFFVIINIIIDRSFNNFKFFLKMCMYFKKKFTRVKSNFLWLLINTLS